MIKRLVAALALCSSAIAAAAQPALQQYIQDNLRQVKSISADTGDLYTDLQPIGRAIGDARIVMLGEQDHGDAPSFIAKTRIIQYLHEQMGFDVLVFESDFWGLQQVWDNRADSLTATDLKRNIYPVWAACRQAQPLYDYVAACFHTSNPLIVTGMDCRHSGQYTKAHYVQFISSVILPALSLPAAEKDFFLKAVNDLLTHEFTSTLTNDEKHQFLELCKRIAAKLPASSFHAQELQSLGAAADHAWYLSYKNPARDLQMAANLRWIANEQYAGKKIIVWAHNMHVAKNLQLIANKQTAPFSTNTGNETYRYFGKQLYVLGFDSYGGMSGRVAHEAYKVKKVKKNSFEHSAFGTGYQYAFADLRGFANAGAFYMKGLSHIQSIKADWTQVFDGIFYIRNMYPCDDIRQ